ncbi:MBL fold metallo-hydrolase [Kordiimonas sp. SCSIO 12610]|uniref:MBL fold metallo-hydrolase n=1 Tax=Kordiimonas sp. SCSIO 12610 TaxID=2829597 RepID=UPI00210F1164|nr:MBL fold metallo-hydrolase [Kordiimonas sp. SCSIO 12610]UTW56308.1 MBL fold metallo-hydrolase [Kordiimonas sp. SCSIO 12610]
MYRELKNIHTNFLRTFALTTALFSGTMMSQSAVSQDFSNVQIRAEKLTDNVYVLFGAGGNIGVSAGKDGVFLIDDQFAPLTDKIKAAIGEFSDQPIRYVVNTHFHFDHSGGNENLGKHGAVIVAHKNVRLRMAKEQFVKAFNARTPAQPDIALPVVTFQEGVTLHLNGDDADVIHVKNAHTDTDSIVHFKQANVIHMGDTFTTSPYPFIDVDNGGGIDGVIEAAKLGLSLADDNTQIIPGHGPMSKKADLEDHLKKLTTTREIIAKLKSEGMSLSEVITAKPLAPFEDTWGAQKPIANWTDLYVEWVYQSLK